MIFVALLGFLTIEELQLRQTCKVEAGGGVADNTKMLVLPKLFYVSAYFLNMQERK